MNPDWDCIGGAYLHDTADIFAKDLHGRPGREGAAILIKRKISDKYTGRLGLGKCI